VVIGVLEWVRAEPISGVGIFLLTENDGITDGTVPANLRNNRQLATAANVGVSSYGYVCPNLNVPKADSCFHA